MRSNCPICNGSMFITKNIPVDIDGIKQYCEVRNLCDFCKGKNHLDWIELITGTENIDIDYVFKEREIEEFRNKKFKEKRYNKLKRIYEKNNKEKLWKVILKKIQNFFHALFVKVNT